MAGYRYTTGGGGADSPVAAWQTLDLSAGTVYGNAAVVTARDATSLTIDPSQNASSFLDNSPDTRGQYWFASTPVDGLDDWPADTPAMLLIEVIRGDTAPAHGTVVGAMLHNSADPTASTAYSGVYVRRKTNGDADGWSINNFGQLGGFSRIFSERQRATCMMMIDADRLKALSYRSRFIDKTGNSITNAQSIVTSATPVAFDITSGLWLSVIAGCYQPNSPADAPSAHTPRVVRAAVVPFGDNP